MNITVIKYIAVALLAAGVIWGLLSYRASLIDKGYEQCIADAKAAKDAADAEARTGIIKEDKDYENNVVIKYIRDTPDSGGTCGPLTDAYFDSLQR